MTPKEFTFDAAYQPQVRAKRGTREIMLDVIIALLPALCVGVWQFGAQALIPLAVSVVSCVFFEWAYRKLLKKPDTIGDLSAVVTGILLAFTLPANCKWWLPIIGAFFAIVVVKQLYGGIGKNFLNPALAGRAFLLASYALFMGRARQSGRRCGRRDHGHPAELYEGRRGAAAVFHAEVHVPRHDARLPR